MRVITFYSYKGGVGRTLACANFGLYLAKAGQRVVLADMDFEAPGLDSKFESIQEAEIEGGLLDQFFALQKGIQPPELVAYDVPLPEDVEAAGGQLRIIPSGDYLSNDYFRKLSQVHWDEIVASTEGIAFCLDLVERIKDRYQADVLIIDSRTGLTEVGGLCTQVLPDDVVLFTSTSRESVEGTKRIYERIINTPISRARPGREEIDAKIVISRVPKPSDLVAYESKMKERLEIENGRIYFLFAQEDLALDEYLALERFARENTAILEDYVELFASFKPTITLPYIKGRIESFRSGITRRSRKENEQLMQELVTLFPTPEVLREAAGYYRITAESGETAVSYYLKYLCLRPTDTETLQDFVGLCSEVPETSLHPASEIVEHLVRYGIEFLSVDVLQKYLGLCEKLENKELLATLVSMLEENDRLEAAKFRDIYLRAVFGIGDWSRFLNTVRSADLRSYRMAFRAAEAYMNVGLHEECFESLRKGFQAAASDPGGMGAVLKTIHRIAPTFDIEDISEILEIDEDQVKSMLRFGSRFYAHDSDSSFSDWLSRIMK